MGIHTIEEILPLLDSNEKKALTDIAEIIVESKKAKKLRKEIEERREEIKNNKIISLGNDFFNYLCQKCSQRYQKHS